MGLTVIPGQCPDDTVTFAVTALVCRDPPAGQSGVPAQALAVWLQTVTVRHSPDDTPGLAECAAQIRIRAPVHPPAGRTTQIYSAVCSVSDYRLQGVREPVEAPIVE